MGYSGARGTLSNQNQGLIDKKIQFFRSPYVTYPDGFALRKKRDGKILTLRHL
jgi:hypothetical protein